MQINIQQLYQRMSSFTGFLFDKFAKILSNFLEVMYLTEHFLIFPLPAWIAQHFVNRRNKN